MTRASSLAGVLAALGTLGGDGQPARADDSPDGLYGRFDGDLEVRASAGLGLQASSPTLRLEASALYLASAGVYATYDEAFGADNALTLRAVGLGLRVAPLFLARFGLDLQRGPPILDLWLDSLSLDLGASFFDRRVTPLAPSAGLSPLPALELGVGMAVPLVPTARGPRLGLRGAVRLLPEVLEAKTPMDLGPQGASLALTFGWNEVVKTGLVDRRDHRPR